MNNSLTTILIFVILTVGCVFALKNRYQVVHDSSQGIYLVDNLDINHTRIIERKSNGMWIAVDVVKGGPSVAEFVTETDSGQQANADNNANTADRPSI